jgi:hypothetical protein
MDTRSLILTMLNFIVFILVQTLIFKNTVLFGVSFAFLYVAFLLFLSFETTAVYLLLAGFFTGFVIDIFYDSLGVHTAACVLMMFARQFWIKSIIPRGGYEIGSTPTIASLGLQWFTIYSLPLIFIHHFLLFYIEAGGFKGLFFFTLSKVLASMVFTYFTVILYQYLFFVRKNRA